MKTHRLILTFFITCWLFSAKFLFADDATQTFLRGLYEESITGDLHKAILLFRKAAEITQDGQLIARAHARVGACLAKLGRIEEAREVFNSVMKKFPDSPVVAQVQQYLAKLPQPESERTKWISVCRNETVSLKELEKTVRRQIENLKSMRDEMAVSAIMNTSKPIGSTDGANLKELVKDPALQPFAARYIASKLFSIGVTFYRNLQYERAEGCFRKSVALDNSFTPAKEYLEKSEFILGKRKTLSPELLTGISSRDEDPLRSIADVMKEAFLQGQKSYDEKRFDEALKKFDEVEKEVRWLSSELLSDNILKVREKAKLLAEDCVANIFPQHTGEMKIYFQEREEAIQAVKRAFDVLLAAEEELVQRARDVIRKNEGERKKLLEFAERLIEDGELQKARNLLLQSLSLDPANDSLRKLLQKVEEMLREPEK